MRYNHCQQEETTSRNSPQGPLRVHCYVHVPIKMQKWFIEPSLPEQAKNMTDVGEQHQRGHCIDKRKSSSVARNLMTSVAARPIFFSPFSLFAGHCGVEQVERSKYHDREEVQLEDLRTLANPSATQPKHTQAHILRESLILPSRPPLEQTHS